MTRQPDDADAILKEFAKKEGKSLRELGIIDERRARTVRQREITFTDFFETRKKRKETNEE